MPSESTKTIYEFGPFRIDLERYLLLRDDKTVPLSPKVFETLIFLIEHRGTVVKKDDIMSRIWPDTFVEESNLAQNIFLLRKALGEEKNEHRYIITIPGVGYRFVAPVIKTSAPASQKIASPPPSISVDSVRSIAVLPFKNLVKEEGDEFLGPGIADALIMRLSSIRHLKVHPTTAVLKYSNSMRDPVVIGRELNADALLDGVYQRVGEQIRVSVQLVSVANGLTLWATKFDENFTNIFAIQDSISEQVVRSLALKLSGEEQKQSRQPGPARRLICFYSRAFLKAARASRRVESKVGSGVSSGRTIKGISVQPSTTASQPSDLSFSITSLKYKRDDSGKTPLTNSLKMISLILVRSRSSGIFDSNLNSLNVSG